MSLWRNQLSGPTDPARDAAWPDAPPRKGFFTDTSICIGCKACEVACKEWNQLPADNLGLTGQSYDNTMSLGANTWRHVAFVEQSQERIAAARSAGARLVDLGMPRVRDAADLSDTPSPLPRATRMRTDHAAGAGLPLGGPGTRDAGPGSGMAEAELAAAQALSAGTVPDFRWLMASDVCKHCTHAACLDVCPTGALFRTEFGTVVVQDDVCNGCGYCVPACPFGVIERRRGGGHGASGDDAGQHGIVAIKAGSHNGAGTQKAGTQKAGAHKETGIAQKCTLCYDRLGIGAKPACAQACPTTSIQFGDLTEMRQRAHERVEALHANGFTEARLYGADPDDGVGGTGSIFLLLDEPEVYGLPPDPVATTTDLPDIFRRAGVAATVMLAGAALSFLGRQG